MLQYLLAGYNSLKIHSIPLQNSFLTLIVNGSTELNWVEVATVLGREKGHKFQYLPGENDSTVWPGIYSVSRSVVFCL